MNEPAPQRTNLLGLPKTELESYVAELGSKPFRARQLMNWLYKRGEGDIAAMTDLAKDFRAQLLQRAEVKLPEIVKTQVATDGTRKWLLSGGNGQAFETVFIPEEDRGTLCISSQVGCVLDCSSARYGWRTRSSAGNSAGRLVTIASSPTSCSWAWVSRWRISAM
jgi:23S rRNA (adenine2503-C2)-methyltransferase